MKNINILIEDEYVKNLKELLIFLAVDGTAIEDYLEVEGIENVHASDLRDELYTTLLRLNI